MRPAARLVPFVPTPLDVVERMLNLAGVDEGEKVYDLGCGDGRIILTAALKYGAEGVGYELRPNLVHHVRQRVRVLRLEDMVRVVNQDLTAASLDYADVVTLYLTAPVLQKIRPHLEQALSKGARIVCHNFPIPGLIPEEVETKSGRRLYLYTKVRRV